MSGSSASFGPVWPCCCKPFGNEITDIIADATYAGVTVSHSTEAGCGGSVRASLGRNNVVVLQSQTVRYHPFSDAFLCLNCGHSFDNDTLSSFRGAADLSKEHGGAGGFGLKLCPLCKAIYHVFVATNEGQCAYSVQLISVRISTGIS